MFFLEARILSDQPAPLPVSKNEKYHFFLDEMLCYTQKCLKTRYFSLLFGGLARSGKCLDIVTDRLGFRFFVFQKRPLKNNGRLNLRPFWTAFGSSPFQK